LPIAVTRLVVVKLLWAAAGELFLGKARGLLQQQEEATTQTRLASTGMIGNLRIGFVGSVSYALLPALVKKFRTLYPNMLLKLNGAHFAGTDQRPAGAP
jgi:DNA-binding transcriptional LysR family regulator